MQPASTPTVKFITVSGQAQEDALSPIVSSQLPLSLLSEPADDVYMGYFASFMAGCQFTRNSAPAKTALDLLPLTLTSPPLRSLALAIGALQSSRRATVRSSDKLDEPRTLAFRFYAEAIRALKHRLEEPDVATSDDVLWSTFLLGLFEVTHPCCLVSILTRQADTNSL